MVIGPRKRRTPGFQEGIDWQQSGNHVDWIGSGNEPVNGSNCSIDYDYFLSRKDIIYATTREIKRLEGAPADFPKLPIVPENALGLCSIDCPPNSTDMTIRNFGLTRITMEPRRLLVRWSRDNEPRQVLLHLVMTHCGGRYTTTELAQRLGKLSVSGLAKAHERMTARLRTSLALRDRVQRLSRKLAEKSNS